MTYFSEHFYWRPASRKWDSSIHLYINDGHQIRLDMDDCKAPKWNECECEEKLQHDCGVADTALSQLSIQELRDLHVAIGKAIEYYEGNKK